MVRALGSQSLCKVIIGLTGENEADGEPLKLAEILEPVLGKAVFGTSKPSAPAASHILVAPDPYEEVRQAVRHVVQQAEKGIPFHQMAILYRNSEPYAELVKTQLELAGIPAAGPNPIPLKDGTAGRSLLNLLKIFSSDYSRQSLIRWVAESPVNLGLEEEYARQAAALWEEISGKAGIIGGAQQWQERLDLFQAENSRKYRRKRYYQGNGENGALEQLALRLKAAAQLKEFVVGLLQNRPPQDGAGWNEFARWAGFMTEKYCLVRSAAKPEQEQYEKVISILDELGRLEVIEPEPVSLTDFIQVLESSLSSSTGRLGTTGSGVFCSQFSSARGMNFHMVHILGMAEGCLPPNNRDDAIIPDRLRLVLGDECRLKITKTARAEERRVYLAVINSARVRLLSFARSGGTSGRRNYPAPWLVDEARELQQANRQAGEPEQERLPAVKSSNLEQLSGESWLTVIQSAYDSLAGLGGMAPADLYDYDMHSLVSWHSLGRKLTSHYLVEKEEDWQRAIQAEQARTSSAFTPWDGNLGNLAGISPRLGVPGETPRSPTQMECWAICPFKYFLTHILKIEVIEKPEEITTISALDRGSLVHRILERFTTTVIKSGQLPACSEAWNDGHRELLMGIARQEMAAVERAGITGRKLLWEVVKNQILADLAMFLDKDNRKRANWASAR
jgi:ATP-dependent helicase/DNAse subunit B